MFDKFAARFRVTQATAQVVERWDTAHLMVAAGYREFFERHAGHTFGDGLYRLHDATSGPRAERSISEAFPEFAGRACPFGYDWLGRQFALDSARSEGGEPLVLLLEPGTGEVLEIPVGLAAFHDTELVEYADDALAAHFFAEWAAAHPESLPLGPDQCVGYRVPLFLGGLDVVQNLEVTDIDVYWSLCAQLRAGVRGLPPGTPVAEVRLDD